MKSKLLRTFALFLALLTLLSVCGCDLSDTLEDLEDIADELENNIATTKIPETDAPTPEETVIITEPVTDPVTDTVTDAPETTHAPETTTPPETTIPPETSQVIDTPSYEYDENGFIKDNIPNGLNYRNEKINLLVWQDCESLEFEFDEYMLSGDIVNDNVYYRNIRVYERLGIEPYFIYERGNSEYSQNWVNYISNSVSVNARAFDIVAGYSLSMAACTAQGLFFNMLDTSCEYLNFENPWWGNNLLDQATIGNKLYYASGDISRSTIEQMFICYANEELLEMYNRGNPQELVKNGEWTYEKFFELCGDVYIDNNNSGNKDCSKNDGDTFGYISSGIYVDPWLYSSGAMICETDNTGKLIMSPSFKGEKLQNTVNMLNEFFKSPAGIYTSSTVHYSAFGQGRAMFIIDRVKLGKSLNIDYAETRLLILPCPKYDINQADYATTIGNPSTLYSMSADIADPTMASAFLECYASDGYRHISPAIYEYTTRDRYGRNELSSLIYDIVRENIVYDPGRIFSQQLIGQTAFRDAIKNSSKWATAVSMQERLLQKAIVNLNKALVP